MLPVGNKFLVEEKTISYVTSGREVVRLASSKSNVQSSKSLVMGNPDFDFDLKSFPEKRVTRVPNSNEEARGKSGTRVAHSSENGLAVTRSLSRDYRGLKFPPLPGAEAEAQSVAKLLGGDGVLRLGAEAREAELKSVQSPRVLDLATHGFFLSDQEFSHTNSGNADLLAGLGARQRVSTTKTDWENPLMRCGIAFAGANRARQITERDRRRWCAHRFGSIAPQFARNGTRHPERMRFQFGRSQEWRGSDVLAPRLSHRRRGDRAGESLEGERQGYKSVDDGIHASLARR